MTIESWPRTFARLLVPGDRFWDHGSILTVTSMPSLADDGYWLIKAGTGAPLRFSHMHRVRLPPAELNVAPPTQDKPGDWLPIPGASGYEIHRDLKRVRSVNRLIHMKDGHTLFRWGQEVRAQLDADGYYRLSIRYDHQKIRGNEKLHRLICLVVHGLPPFPEALVRHLNDVKTDNRPENLAWGTKSDNAWDSIANGLHAETNKTHCKHKHPLDRIAKNGSRWCSTCDRLRIDRAREKRQRARKTAQSCGSSTCLTPEPEPEEIEEIA